MPEPRLLRLCLVRHGITPLQEERRYCGHSNPGLSGRGIAQVESLAASLQFDAAMPVFASDLARATESARLLSPSPFTSLPCLREINFGAWEGLRFDEVGCADPAALCASDFQFPGGESAAMLCARVHAGVGDLLASPFPSALVVAHAGSIAALMMLLLGESWEQSWQRVLPHAGVAWLRRDGSQWSLV